MVYVLRQGKSHRDMTSMTLIIFPRNSTFNSRQAVHSRFKVMWMIQALDLIHWLFSFFRHLFPNPSWVGEFLSSCFCYFWILLIFFLKKIAWSRRVHQWIETLPCCEYAGRTLNGLLLSILYRSLGLDLGDFLYIYIVKFSVFFF